jgi:tetratricopeptide (TPR) repeat protein
MRLRTIALAWIATGSIATSAQQPATFNFVTANSRGRIILPLGPDWVPDNIALFDQGTRPAITYQNKSTGIVLSVILFPNATGQPTSESCRDAVIRPILDNLSGSATVIDQKKDRRIGDNGLQLALESYRIEKTGDIPLQQQNEFGFYGDKSTCAEVHLSKVRYADADAAQFESALKLFKFEPGYEPTARDYGLLGTVYFTGAHNPAAAAVYYQRALDTLPPTPEDLNTRRAITDQLAMSYGISGDIDRSRKVNEAAIAHDPDYPLYYYNLACADAEEGNADAAREHLQQAFDRRHNTLPREQLPDPSSDDSLAKLKDNAPFWSLVTRISAQEKKEANK